MSDQKAYDRTLISCPKWYLTINGAVPRPEGLSLGPRAARQVSQNYINMFLIEFTADSKTASNGPTNRVKLSRVAGNARTTETVRPVRGFSDL